MTEQHGLNEFKARKAKHKALEKKKGHKNIQELSNRMHKEYLEEHKYNKEPEF